MSISSHVARGAIGNRSAVFALEIFGFPVWAIPTVVLPWHPGHGRATRIEPDGAQFAAMLGELAASRWRGEVGAILTGYMANAAQAQAVAGFVAAMKAGNPAIRYLCDPVIGDSGGLYVPQATAQTIRDRLLPLADIATPNRHELAWLTGRPPLDTAEAVAAAAGVLGPPVVLATSTPALMRGSVANLLWQDGAAMMAEHRLVDGPANGGGDLVSGLFLAHLLRGATARDALARATASIFEIVARAAARGADELTPQIDRESLLAPAAMVAVRALARPSRA